MVELTPTMAKYILKYHNKDNRAFYKSQLAALRKSLDVDGWQKDGWAMTFNTDGNLTEFQHRLHEIAELGITVWVPVVVGVAKDSFVKTAPPKQRHPVDEMYRKDPTAIKEDETALRQVLARRGDGEDKLTMQNAIVKWKLWKLYVRKGRELTKDIVNNTETYKSWKKELLGFCTLMVFIGEEDVAKKLLKLLKNHVLRAISGYLWSKSSKRPQNVIFHHFFQKISI